MKQADQVILVDKNDNEIGFEEKMEAHKKGLLHRAISVFILDSSGKWLIQKRAFSKYHSRGLWSNTACSHPQPEETELQAAERRLMQEMGLKADLQEVFKFIYNEKLDNNLTEHELDHVFIGITDSLPIPNSEEVSDFKYLDYNSLIEDINQYPDRYTVWFKKIVDQVESHIKKLT